MSKTHRRVVKSSGRLFRITYTVPDMKVILSEEWDPLSHQFEKVKER